MGISINNQRSDFQDKVMALRGRPTKYDDSFIDKVEEYLKQAIDKYEMVMIGDKMVSQLVVNLPSIEGFCIWADIGISTLYLWKEKYPDFMEALRDIETAQKNVIMQKGISGQYNSTIGKLILSSNHGMRERNDLTSDDKPIQSNTIVVKRMDDNATNS